MGSSAVHYEQLSSGSETEEVRRSSTWSSVTRVLVWVVTIALFVVGGMFFCHHNGTMMSGLRLGSDTATQEMEQQQLQAIVEQDHPIVLHDSEGRPLGGRAPLDNSSDSPVDKKELKESPSRDGLSRKYDARVRHNDILPPDRDVMSPPPPLKEPHSDE